MKIFGNKKHRVTVPDDHKEASAPVVNETEQEEDSSRLQPLTKAILLMAGAICLFVCAVVMCLTLIRQSSEVSAMPLEEPEQISYVVNIEPPATENVPVELEAPESMYQSNRLNFLMIGIDDATDLNNLLLLVSVDLHTKDVAAISIPRETYISGNFKYPAAFTVYKDAEGGKHGINAIKEKVKEMIGFWPDYYFVLNTKSINGLMEITGDIDFEVPEEPAYCDLPSGQQRLNASKAVKLLNFRNEYNEISTEPARTQRMFLQTLFSKLLENSEKIEENARAIAAFANTDLSSDDLAFLGHLLQGADMRSIYSRALPGEVIEAGGAKFYQVDPDEATVMLNECFNPLEDELTVYDLNFRQLAGDSGVGTYAAYGFGNGYNYTTDDNPETDNTEDVTEDTEETNTPETDATVPPEPETPPETP